VIQPDGIKEDKNTNTVQAVMYTVKKVKA